MGAEQKGYRAERLSDVEARLGYRFADRTLLDRALTHASVVGPHGGRGPSNERMEFLGDRVIGLAVAFLLYRRFPSEEEGELARRHTALVRRESLAEVASALGIDASVKLSRGEEDAGGRNNPALLADACEAVIAAVFLDGGWENARSVVARHWRSLINQDAAPPKDAKTALQEWLQARGTPLPVYQVVDRKGPPHAPMFSVEVQVNGHDAMMARGPSKRVAEQTAARDMLAFLSQETDHS